MRRRRSRGGRDEGAEGRRLGLVFLIRMDIMEGRV
jgi:hypothetical protein